MNTYDVLNRMKPVEFLNANTFVTGYDRPDYGQEQYAKGLRIASESREVGVSANGTWYAVSKDGKGYTISYEGIGYHANTANLLRGFLDSGVPVVIHRYVDGAGYTETKIKG